MARKTKAAQAAKLNQDRAALRRINSRLDKLAALRALGVSYQGSVYRLGLEQAALLRQREQITGSRFLRT